MTPYQSFLKKYERGCGSCQCDKATRIVFARGSVPCDVLFVGEAPGASEDVRGIPFDGPAGKLLDVIVEEALDKSGHEQDSGGFGPNGEPINVWAPADVRMAFTNLVGCLPRDIEGSKAGEPDMYQIKHCRPRLTDFINLCKPKLVVCVGELSRKYVMGDANRIALGIDECVALVHIVHPACILRSVPAQKPLLIRRCVVTLANAVKEL